MSVKRGDVVLTSEPFVFIVLAPFSKTYCDQCLQPERSDAQIDVACPSCSEVRYCSDSCWDLAFPLHKHECAAQSRLPPGAPPPSGTARLLARLIIKLHSEGEDVEESIDLDTDRKFSQLVHHVDQIKNDSKRKEEITRLYEEVGSIIKEASFMPPREKFMQLYGKVLVNSTSILDDWLTPVARGLYLAGSILDHSCIPTVFVSFRGPMMVGRSLVDTPTLRLDQMKVPYVDVLSDTIERQQILHSTYYFTCDCPICACPIYSSLPYALKCGNSECPSPIFINGLKDVNLISLLSYRDVMGPTGANNNKEVPCNCCDFHVTYGQNSTISEAESILSCPPSKGKTPCKSGSGVSLQDIITCSSCGFKNSTKANHQKYSKAVEHTKKVLGVVLGDLPGLEECNAVVSKQEDILHPLNPWRAIALNALFNKAVESGSTTVAIDTAYENMTALRFYYGSSSPTYGNFLMKLGKLEFSSSNHRKALPLLQDAQILMKTGVGASHPLVRNCISKMVSEIELSVGKKFEKL